MSLFRTLLSQSKSSRLPNEYQEVEWIKGSGTQYIDTGFVATGGMTCEYIVSHDIDYTTYSVDGGYIIGSHSNSSPYGRNGSYYKPYASGWELGYGETYNSYTTPLVYEKKYNVLFSTIIGNAYLKVDGETLLTNTTTQTISNTNVYIFNHYYNIRHNGKSTIAKLYYAKVWNSSNEVVREFIPCYRKSDGVIGLYDLVNNVFYTNAGTGTFLKGQDIGGLPSIYQQVEYIQSTGTQFINTGYIHKTNSRYELSFAMVYYYTQYNTVFGGRKNWNTPDAFDLGVRNNNDTYVNLGTKNPAKFYTITLDKKIDVNMDTSRIIIDNVTLEYVNGVNPDNVPITSLTLTDGLYTIYLFALNQSNNIQEYSITKLYSFKVYEGDALKMDLIPCYRKRDNIIGMYDKKSNIFFTNAGTGTFLKGSDV